MKKLFIKVAKGKNGQNYSALCVNLGYCVKYLCFDRNTCAELLNMNVPDLLSEEKVYELCEF